MLIKRRIFLSSISDITINDSCYGNYCVTSVRGRCFLLILVILLGPVLASGCSNVEDKQFRRETAEQAIAKQRQRVLRMRPELALGQTLQTVYRNTATNVINIISEYTGIPRDKITMESHLFKDFGVGGLEFVETVMAWEEHFHIEIPRKDLERLYIVGAANNYIRDKVKKRIKDVERFHDELLAMAQSGKSVPSMKQLMNIAEQYWLQAYLVLGPMVIEQSSSTPEKMSTLLYQSPKYWPIIVWLNKPRSDWSEYTFLPEQTAVDTELEVGENLRVLFLR